MLLGCLSSKAIRKHSDLGLRVDVEDSTVVIRSLCARDCGYLEKKILVRLSMPRGSNTVHVVTSLRIQNSSYLENEVNVLFISASRIAPPLSQACV
jgi:hypothetical protein